MRSDEVKKIGDSLKLAYKEKPKESQVPLMEQPKLGDFVRDRMPQKLVKDGNVIDYKLDSMMGEHEGIHPFVMLLVLSMSPIRKTFALTLLF